MDIFSSDSRSVMTSRVWACMASFSALVSSVCFDFFNSSFKMFLSSLRVVSSCSSTGNFWSSSSCSFNTSCSLSFSWDRLEFCSFNSVMVLSFSSSISFTPCWPSIEDCRVSLVSDRSFWRAVISPWRLRIFMSFSWDSCSREVRSDCKELESLSCPFFSSSM